MLDRIKSYVWTGESTTQLTLLFTVALLLFVSDSLSQFSYISTFPEEFSVLNSIHLYKFSSPCCRNASLKLHTLSV